MENVFIIICEVAILCLSAAFFTLSVRQFSEKGVLLNNMYYPRGSDGTEKSKKPYYRQSGVIFAGCGSIFLFAGLRIITGIKPFEYLMFAAIAFVIVYAVVSSFIINIREK